MLRAWLAYLLRIARLAPFVGSTDCTGPPPLAPPSPRLPTYQLGTRGSWGGRQ